MLVYDLVRRPCRPTPVSAVEAATLAPACTPFRKRLFPARRWYWFSASCRTNASSVVAMVNRYQQCSASLWNGLR